MHVPVICLAAAAVYLTAAAGGGTARDLAAQSPAPFDLTRAESRAVWRALLEPGQHYLAETEALLVSAQAWTGEDRERIAAAAAESARDALARKPASGYAWLALAWAEFMAGNEEASKSALAMARRWAPNSGNMAIMRLSLALHWWSEAGPEERARMLEEARLARAVRRDDFVEASLANPRLKTLWRLIYESDRAEEPQG